MTGTTNRRGHLAALPRPAAHWLLTDEPINGLDERNLRILEAASHEAALLASEDPSPPRPDEVEHIAAINAFVGRLTGRGR